MQVGSSRNTPISSFKKSPRPSTWQEYPAISSTLEAQRLAHVESIRFGINRTEVSCERHSFFAISRTAVHSSRRNMKCAAHVYQNKQTISSWKKWLLLPGCRWGFSPFSELADIERKLAYRTFCLCKDKGGGEGGQISINICERCVASLITSASTTAAVEIKRKKKA